MVQRLLVVTCVDLWKTLSGGVTDSPAKCETWTGHATPPAARHLSSRRSHGKLTRRRTTQCRMFQLFVALTCFQAAGRVPGREAAR